MMLGKAQQLFEERISITPPQHASGKQTWPFLDKMLSLDCLDYFDYAIAQRYNAGGREDVAAYLCHLTKAARKGHLCIRIDDDTIVPSPSDIWQPDDCSLQLSPEDLTKLHALIIQGADHIPETLRSDTGDEQSLVQKRGPLHYLQKYWSIESEFKQSLCALLQTEHPTIPIDVNVALDRIKYLQNEGLLLPEQANAVRHSCQSTLTIITGGPGTGKTYTAGLILSLLWESLPSDKRNPQSISITLAAPTGKAAANLEASIKRSIKGCNGFPDIPGQTLHQLLQSRRDASFQTLSADILIVDECSMIDADMMRKLLNAVKPGARLILLGDKHQLPAVEAGSLFADMGNLVPCIELKTCLRAESAGIRTFSDSIKQGDIAAVDDLFNGSSYDGVHAFSMAGESSPKEQQLKLLKHVIPRFPMPHSLPSDLSELLDQFNRFRILTPLRRGMLGSESINAAIAASIQTKQHEAAFSITPIMIVKNDYRIDLFNGEVGLLIQDKGCTAGDYAIFPSRNAGEPMRGIPSLLLPKYELAYCLSVHKSQGSEFDHVLLLLPEGSETFGREGLYTGASRAKKQLDIWSCPEIVKAMIQKRAIRQSGLT